MRSLARAAWAHVYRPEFVQAQGQRTARDLPAAPVGHSPQLDMDRSQWSTAQGGGNLDPSAAGAPA
jgi:hypothetical protein